MKNTSLARKIAELYEELTGKEFPGGAINAMIIRTYAGYWQRAAGAWSWFLVPIEGPLRGWEICGSMSTASKVARKPNHISHLTSKWGDVELFVEREPIGSNGKD